MLKKKIFLFFFRRDQNVMGTRIMEKIKLKFIQVKKKIPKLLRRAAAPESAGSAEEDFSSVPFMVFNPLSIFLSSILPYIFDLLIIRILKKEKTTEIVYLIPVLLCCHIVIL